MPIKKQNWQCLQLAWEPRTEKCCSSAFAMSVLPCRGHRLLYQVFSISLGISCLLATGAPKS